MVAGSLAFLVLLGFYEVEVKGGTANTSGNAYSGVYSEAIGSESESDLRPVPKLPSSSAPAPKRIDGEDDAPRLE